MSEDVAAFGTYALPQPLERLRRFGLVLGRGALARRACSLIRRIVSLGRAGPFDVEAFPGQMARLYPAENLSDKRVFAAAQFWDWTERAALAESIKQAEPPFHFVDAGANAGLYTLAVRSAADGRAVRAIAIEPDPENLRRLRFNLAASGATDHVTVAALALSDTRGAARITTSHANRGELAVSDDGDVAVEMAPLLDIVREAGFTRIDALKIDIEGMEERVLATYFDTAERRLWPKMMIVEARHGEMTEALALLLEKGYHVEQRSRLNVVLSAPAPDRPARTTGKPYV